jgi:hypothetical protein
LLVAVAIGALAVACGGTAPTTPVPSAVPSAPRSAVPSAPPSAASPARSAAPSSAGPTSGASAAVLPRLFPLPADLLPVGGTIPIAPKTARSAVIGTPYPYTLEHCGVGSPVDFDGSLWDVLGAQDGRDGPVTEQQIGEIINPGTGTMTLVDAEHALFRTSSRLIVGLRRHAGEKRFPPCA